jgi:RimJ/RimL family protein N-acetyltransferase
MEKQPERIRDLSGVKIESERLILAPISLDFDKEIFTEFNDNVTEFMARGPNESLEATDDFIKKSIEQTKVGEKLQLMVMSKEGEFLGLTSIEKANTQTPELGLWLKEVAQRQGFGRELIFALADWAQNNLEFNHLIYRADVENPGSWKIAEKLIGEYGGKYVGEAPETLRDGERMTKHYQISKKS